MQEQVTVCYVLNERLKSLVQQWARDNDRTASAELRQILEREVQRRKAKPTDQKQPQ
jgi:hypothetical protein